MKSQVRMRALQQVSGSPGVGLPASALSVWFPPADVPSKDVIFGFSSPRLSSSTIVSPTRRGD
jgi:hypothetical protein